MRARTTLAKLVFSSLLAGGLAHAAPPPKKGKEKKEQAPTAQDFLGDFGKEDKNAKKNEDLGKALSGAKKQGPAGGDDLTPKSELQQLDTTVTMTGLFVAPKIMTAGNGCVAPKAGGEVKSLEAPDLPFTLNAFSVCAHLASNRNRAVQITFKIVTAKGRQVAQSEETVDFAGRKVLDHVVDFPEMPFHYEGKYYYRMEVEGVMVTQQELFEIKLKNRPAQPAEPAAQ